jgi:4-hydroxy-3-methylbut-2-en-1-yl diphosphate reductase
VIKLAFIADAGFRMHPRPRPGHTLLLAGPRGFCAGVIRAIETVRAALQKLGPPVYVRREIVHNRHVVEELAAEGAIFVETLDPVPDGAVLVFSAHGVAPSVREEAERRHLRVIDATCPLVAKVHLEAIRYARENYSIVLIGHPDHDEVVGTAGEAPAAIRLVSSIEDVDRLELPVPTRAAYLTQTTLSVDDTAEIVARLAERFPAIQAPAAQDICYATQNRQDAVKELARRADVVLVIGSDNSSNSKRLAEVSRELGTPAYLVDDESEVDPGWLADVDVVGITSGASAPEWLVDRMLSWLASQGATEVQEIRLAEESVRFSLPPGVRSVPSDPGYSQAEN